MKKRLICIAGLALILAMTIAYGGNVTAKWTGPSGQGDLTYVDSSSQVLLRLGTTALLDYTAVGSVSPSSGAFTTLDASGATTAAALTMTGALEVGGVITNSDTTASSSSGTGAIVTLGGIGAAKDIRSGSDIYAADDVIVVDDVSVTGTVVVTEEVRIDGKWAITGGDATTALMVQKAAITSSAAGPQTNSFAVAFGAAPIVVCSYTEDPGDVRPLYVTLVTASNFVCTVTADKNFGYVAVGSRP